MPKGTRRRRAAALETTGDTASPNSSQHDVTSDESSAASEAPKSSPSAASSEVPPTPPPVSPWSAFVKHASENDIRDRFSTEAKLILNVPELADAAVVAILRPDESITAFELDQIYTALMDRHPDSFKNVVLILLSRGGEIEPAYQIAKVCKTFAKDNKFLVLVPRQAKSAATLIALGADEIHIGPLGQLGPIDPQIGGLPALGVAQALLTIASLVERFPKSADMFAKYLRMAVEVEHIGYSDRVAASAVQYAERLLASKSYIGERAAQIANRLVYEYKDHNFVIDAEEAFNLLGNEWVHIWSSLEAAAERIYNLFDWVNLWLSVAQRKQRLIVSGSFAMNGVFLLDKR